MLATNNCIRVENLWIYLTQLGPVYVTVFINLQTESMSKYEGIRRKDYWLYVAHQEIMSYSIEIQLMKHIMVF